jgi:cysteine desulfuration protein SufE
MMSAPVSIDSALTALAEEFDLLGDWEARFGHVIELGRALAPLSPEERTDPFKVRGCASQVWLVPSFRDGRVHIRAGSDAHLVQGLLALVVQVFSGRTPEEILASDPQAIFARLGFSGALSPQRSNGLASIIAKLRDIAHDHTAA